MDKIYQYFTYLTMWYLVVCSRLFDPGAEKDQRWPKGMAFVSWPRGLSSRFFPFRCWKKVRELQKHPKTGGQFDSKQSAIRNLGRMEQTPSSNLPKRPISVTHCGTFHHDAKNHGRQTQGGFVRHIRLFNKSQSIKIVKNLNLDHLD